jgi:lysyl-tRNA synthetase class 2
VLAFPFMRDDKQRGREETAAEVVDIKPMPVEGIAHK